MRCVHSTVLLNVIPFSREFNSNVQIFIYCLCCTASFASRYAPGEREGLNMFFAWECVRAVMFGSTAVVSRMSIACRTQCFVCGCVCFRDEGGQGSSFGSHAFLCVHIVF
jgi:hypothetical protein